MRLQDFYRKAGRSEKGLSVVELMIYMAVTGLLGVMASRALNASASANFIFNGEAEQRRAYDALRFPIADIREANSPFESWPTEPDRIPWFKYGNNGGFVCYRFTPDASNPSQGFLVRLEKSTLDAGDAGHCDATGAAATKIILKNVALPTTASPLFQQDQNNNVLIIKLSLQSPLRTGVGPGAANKPIEVVRWAAPRI